MLPGVFLLNHQLALKMGEIIREDNSRFYLRIVKNIWAIIDNMVL